MKLSIGVVVAILLCMQIQTIQAILFSSESKCESDLRTFKAEVEEWRSSDFGDRLDETQNQLNIVRNGYNRVNGILSVTEPTESEIAEYFILFCEVHEIVQPAITQCRLTLDVLQRSLDIFINGQKVVCNKDFTGKGCEAKLNREKCNLLAFRDELAVSVVKTKALLDDRVKYCDVLFGMRRAFYLQYNPSDDSQKCGCGTGHNGSGSSVVVNDFVNIFVPSFRVPHDKAFGLITEIGDEWNQILKAAEALTCKK